MEILQLLGFMIIPTIVMIATTIYFRVNWAFGLIGLPVLLLVFWGIYEGFSASRSSDSEVWNGMVTGKTREEVSCSHSYECHCYYTTSTDSKGNSTSTRHCSTCYEHSYDVDWDVASTIGGFSIDRVDRQGIDMPARWAHTSVGDPVSTVKSFTNYIRGAEFSIFHNDAYEVEKRWKDKLPEYPTRVYDYWHIDRVIPVGVNIRYIGEWNRKLEEALKTLGPSRQANVVVVITSATDTSFADALNTSWIGGKKNDAVVVIGTSHYPDIEWVRVISWTPNNLFKVMLRDDLLDSHHVSPDKTIGIIADAVKKNFIRMQMKDYEYLKDQIGPTDGALIFMWVLSALAGVGTFFLLRNMADSETIFEN